MTVLEDFRAKYPQYKDVPDGKLAAAIRKKYYADMPAPDFYRKAGLEHLVGLPEKPENGLGTDAQNYLAGMGKSVVDNARGAVQGVAALGKKVFAPGDVVAQLTGAPNVLGDAAASAYDRTRQEQTDVNQTDAPLMATKAGLAGNISGQAMQAIGAGSALKMAGAAPSVLPSSYTGATLAGGVQGAIQPLDNTQTEGDRLMNAGVGAGAGAGGYALPAIVGTGARTLRSLVDPLTNNGQQRIIANTLAKFGQGGNLVPEASAVPGVQPTLAEATGNAGIGQLQRAVTDAGSGDGTLNAFVQRGLENNAARVNAVRGVAGTPDDLAQAIEQRAGAADAMYGQAASTDAMRLELARQEAKQAANAHLGGRGMYGGAKGADAVESGVLRASPALESLAQRPGFQQAVKQAEKLAADQGVNLGDPLKSVQGLHYVKLALDDMMQPNAASAIGRNQQSALQGTKQALLAEMEKISPLYAQAKDVFQQMSGPVNAMQTGQAFLGKAGGNALDQMGNPVLTANRFAGNLSKLDEIAQKATGFKGAKADKVFTPEQLAVLQAVNKDLGKKAAAESVGKSAGSNTVQNLASQNFLNQLTGGRINPTGTVAGLLKPMDTLYKLWDSPNTIRGKLAELMLNPHSAESAKILSRIPAAQRPAFEKALAPFTGAVGQQAGVGVRK